MISIFRKQQKISLKVFIQKLLQQKAINQIQIKYVVFVEHIIILMKIMIMIMI